MQKKLQMSLINDLNWRYATKSMTGEKISQEKLDAILEATSLTASSYGLQAYKILIVSNADVKAKLQVAGYNQVQFTESDVVLIFAVQEKLTAEDVEAYVAKIIATRNPPAESLPGIEGYKQMMLSTVNSLTDEQQQEWSAKQAYIALGTALIAAAEQKVDACPMEGFDKNAFDEILNLKEMGLKSVVAMPLGYRAADDYMAHLAKVRKEHSELYHFVQ